jgi:hypothetical protein
MFTNKKTITIVFVLLICSGLYLVFSADPAGYCRKTGRFLSDEEFIEIAVRNEVKFGNMRIDGREGSIRAFHADHPNCCRVNREAGSLIDRMLGSNFVGVDMYYEVNEKTLKAHPVGGEYYEVHLNVTACGRPGDWAGMRTEKGSLPVAFQ